MNKIETAMLVSSDWTGNALMYAETAASVWPGYGADEPLGAVGYWIGNGIRRAWVADNMAEALATWEGKLPWVREDEEDDEEEEEGQDDGPADTWQDEQAADYYEGSFEF